MTQTQCDIGDSHCITCGDEALVATVVSIDDLTAMAVVAIGDDTTEVDISLMDHVAMGDALLVHGGVALGEAEHSGNLTP